MRAMEAVVFCGIQASGKTTFYRERFAATHVRVSLDDVRTRPRERALIARCIRDGASFVVDNTNATRARRAPYIAAARDAGYRVIGYFFRTDPRKAFERNRRRTGREVIPAAGLFGTAKRLEPPTIEEGFDELHVVEIADGGRFVVS